MFKQFEATPKQFLRLIAGLLLLEIALWLFHPEIKGIVRICISAFILFKAATGARWAAWLMAVFCLLGAGFNIFQAIPEFLAAGGGVVFFFVATTIFFLWFAGYVFFSSDLKAFYKQPVRPEIGG
jgi:hypothetical protein